MRLSGVVLSVDVSQKGWQRDGPPTADGPSWIRGVLRGSEETSKNMEFIMFL